MAEWLLPAAVIAALFGEFVWRPFWAKQTAKWELQKECRHYRTEDVTPNWDHGKRPLLRCQDCGKQFTGPPRD